MKKLKKEGKLEDQEESEEINACSIVVPVEVDGQVEEWLVNFTNETHNHPTEIEPFGGAATCLGGAIRDPSPDIHKYVLTMDLGLHPQGMLQHRQMVQFLLDGYVFHF